MKGTRKKIFDLGTFVNVLSLGALAITYLEFFDKKAIEHGQNRRAKNSMSSKSNPKTEVSDTPNLGEGLSSNNGAELQNRPNLNPSENSSVLDSNSYKIMEEVKKKTKDLKAQITETKEIEIENESKLEEVKTLIEQARTSYDKGTNIVQKTIKDLDETIRTSSDNSDTSTEEAIRLLAEENAEAANDFSNGSYALEKALEILSNIKKGGGSGSTNFSENITQLILEYKEFLSTLDSTQILSLIHILTGLSLLFCLYNLVVIFFGDLIIKHFKLEEKYPKLAKFIELRRKFQQYYFFLNVFIITIIVVSMIFANVLIFML